MTYPLVQVKVFTSQVTSSISTQWIGTQSCTNIIGSPTMYPNVNGDRTFHKAPLCQKLNKIPAK